MGNVSAYMILEGGGFLAPFFDITTPANVLLAVSKKSC